VCDIDDKHRAVGATVSYSREDAASNSFGLDYTVIGGDGKHFECKDDSMNDHDKLPPVIKRHVVLKAMDRIRRRMLRLVRATRFIKADNSRSTNSI